MISCIADYVSGEVVLQEDEVDECSWVSLKEAKDYNLIEGIYDELVMAEDYRNGVRGEWKKVI